MLSILFSLLMLMVALAMVVNTVRTQPLKLEVSIKESNKTDEGPINRKKVMVPNSRQDALGCSLGCEGLETQSVTFRLEPPRNI